MCGAYSRKGIRSALNVSGKFLMTGGCRESLCGKRLGAVGSQTAPVG